MTLPSFNSLQKEQQDRIASYMLSGDCEGGMRELAAIVREEHANVSRDIKRLRAGDPNMPVQYAALQAELALLTEMEALLVGFMNSTLPEELKHV